ncbi:MAG: PAS domain S-box protein, partial [Actinomycetota bacterium]|nr:PAS domain S-box protein [Actinomycetota bacterium]
MKANWYADGGRRSGLRGYGIAVAAVAGATLLKLLLATVIQQESPFLVFFFAVLASAWLGGWRAGLAATALAALSADFLFMSPYYSLAVDNSGQILRLVVFFVEGSLTSVIVSELYGARRQAEERAAEIQGYQENLKENEERSRRLADEVVEALALSENGKIFDANKTFTRMFGYGLDELIGMDVVRFVAPEDRERVANQIAADSAEAYEVRGLRKDGSVFPVKIQPRPVLHQGRKIRVTPMIDLTERKRTERVLRSNEALQRAVVDSAFDAIITMVADGTIRSFNQGAERIFGYEAREVMGQELALLMPERFREMHRSGLHRYLETGQAHGLGRRMIELAGLRKSGEEFPLELTISEVREEGPLFIGVIRDITERKLAEEELRRSEQSLATAQRIAHLGSWEYVLDEDSAQWSNELYRVFGFTPQEFVPRYKTFFDYVHPDDRRSIQKEALRALRGRGNSNIDYRIVRSDGEVRGIHTEYEVVRDASGRPTKIAGTVQDITERKEVEDELEARNEDLARSNAELEQFAYVASHDLQEPLRMVSSYTQLLARRYKGKLDEDADEFIGYAVDGATRMQILINDLLSYSRIGRRSKDPEPVDLSVVFEAALANLKIAIEESGASVTAGPLPTVVGDATQLVQLFQNLLGNAIKFRGEASPEIEVRAERRGREWMFFVRDNGV